MKKASCRDGIAPWKIDHPVERLLARAADKSELGKYLYVSFYRVFDKAYYSKGLKFIRKNVQTFVGDVSEKQLRGYIYDMVYSLHRFGCMFDEYFFYHFPDLNVRARESFITDKIRWDYYARMNLDENIELFNNKRKAYERFGDYYKRELIEIGGEQDWEAFQAFTKRHHRFMVKPVDGSGGKGIYIADTADYSNEEDLFTHILKNGAVVLEELIVQCEEMASLHPVSLNTVRVITLKLKDRTVIFRPVLRMGSGNSVVDNAASGGIIVAVDADTGICCMDGADEKGHRYLCHPDTGTVLPGFRIPRWNEAVELAKELAEAVDSNHYVGWDLALTDAGWVMVEGNPRGQFIIQIATERGIKEEIEGYIAQM